MKLRHHAFKVLDGLGWLVDEPIFYLILVMLCVLFFMIFGCGDEVHRGNMDINVVPCEVRPEGNLAFACGSSPTGWCFGEYAYRCPSWYHDDSCCEAWICEDEVGLDHEVCHCTCQVAGRNHEDGSNCMRGCEQ